MNVRKVLTVKLHRHRCYDLIESIDNLDSNAVASAINGLIEDVFVLMDNEPRADEFIDKVIEELNWHTT